MIQDPKLKPFENSPVYITNIQWEESNLKIWLKGLGGNPIILDQYYSTVGKDRGF
jgi:hypothetical protein